MVFYFLSFSIGLKIVSLSKDMLSAIRQDSDQVNMYILLWSAKSCGGHVM